MSMSFGYQCGIFTSLVFVYSMLVCHVTFDLIKHSPRLFVCLTTLFLMVFYFILLNILSNIRYTLRLRSEWSGHMFPFIADDAETSQWKGSEVYDLINIWGDSSIQAKLEGSYQNFCKQVLFCACGSILGHFTFTQEICN